MTESGKLPPKDPAFESLLDQVFFGEADEVALQQLEQKLIADPQLQQQYLDFAEFAFNLTQSAKLNQIQSEIVDKIAGLETQATGGRIRSTSRQAWFAGGISLAILFGFAIGWFVTMGKSSSTDDRSAIAWLVNAQSCEWDQTHRPSGNMKASDRLTLRNGVALIRFACGADLMLEGPADVELLSSTSVYLVRGKASVKVPKGMQGFEVFSPQGRILDLGTEFGVTVSAKGTTDVVVFDGEVETFVGSNQSQSLRIRENQSAIISDKEMKITEIAQSFIRSMEDVVDRPIPLPQMTEFKFDGSIATGIHDRNDRSTGFDIRLPGTGGELRDADRNLEIDPNGDLLKMTTTRSDINHQVNLENGEYIGIRLSKYGFTGDEDFSVTVELPDIPNLEDFGQFGLFAGTRSDLVIRGGLIKWGEDESKPNTLFMVNNSGGTDRDSNKIGLLNEGIDVKLTLARRGGKYTMTAVNMSDGGSATLSIRHPEFLNDQNEMIVGIFGANPFSDVRKTVSISKFSITVWRKPDHF